jgi:GNAT superfamily N-acetyltransferase
VLLALFSSGSYIDFRVWALSLAGPIIILFQWPDSVGRTYVSEAIVKKDLKCITTHYLKSPRSHFWVAVTGKDVVKGCVAVEEVLEGNSDGWAVGDAELRRMSVDNRCRGAGVAKKLFAELKRFCSAKGFKRVVLSTTDWQHDACKMYPKVYYQTML